MKKGLLWPLRQRRQVKALLRNVMEDQEVQRRYGGSAGTGNGCSTDWWMFQARNWQQLQLWLCSKGHRRNRERLQTTGWIHLQLRDRLGTATQAEQVAAVWGLVTAAGQFHQLATRQNLGSDVAHVVDSWQPTGMWEQELIRPLTANQELSLNDLPTWEEELTSTDLLRGDKELSDY